MLRLLLATALLLACQSIGVAQTSKWGAFKKGVVRSFKFRHIIYHEDVKIVPPGQQQSQEATSTEQNIPQRSAYLPLIYNSDVKNSDKDNVKKNVSVCANRLFAVIKMDKQIPVVDFWSLAEGAPDATLAYGGFPCIDKAVTISSNKRFELDLERDNLGDPTISVKVPFRTFVFGVSTIPIRIRQGLPAPATGQVNASVFSGFAWGKTQFNHRGSVNRAWTLGPFVGLTLVDLKKAQYINQAKYEVDQSLPAISYGLSLVRSINKVGLVFSLGRDHAYGGNAKEWRYQDKMWLGFGVSTSFDFPN